MNLKDFKAGVVRCRGTTIAAAALSVAMVAPFVSPVVAPQTAAVASAQQTGTVVAPDATDPNAVIEADAIADGYISSGIDLTNAYATLSGKLGLMEDTASSSIGGEMGINDATVFMQFRDSDGIVSPVYSAKTYNLPGAGGGNGQYAFDLRMKDAGPDPR